MIELSGDDKLNIIKKIKYFLYNIIRGIFGYGNFNKIKFWHYKIEGFKNTTPARLYIDEFLKLNLLNLIKYKNIEVLDVGCGDGYIRQILRDMDYSVEYTGVDIYMTNSFRNFESAKINSIFVESKIEEFNSTSKFDLVLSMTALEHIKDDYLAINKCTQMCKKNGVQIHIIPSFWSLFLYFCHGYRQYNPRRIAKLFKGLNYEVYRAGGLFTFLLHLLFITIPLLLFKSNKLRNIKQYATLMRLCSKLDKFVPFFSTVYVVIVK
jgi:SAM-dependent methyltransferase